MQKEYLASAEEVLEEQASNAETGLTASVAQQRLSQFGPNKLDEEEKTPLWIRFFQQMADPMVIMLIVAAVISAVTGMIQGESEWADVVIIMAVVIINSALGVIQEAKSEEALEALQEMSAAQSKVIRDGKMTMLHSSELVPGDVVLLEAGDSVPADCRVLESASMKIEEAALTGESVPVEKHADAIVLEAGVDDVPLGDRKNMCYMGSTVVYGRGRAVVVGTGMKTEMGKIAGALTEAKEELTPLQMKLAELSKILTIMVIVICVVIFAVDLLRSGIGNVASEPQMLLDTFMVAVSLAVAAIPEGLVAVVTIVLSIGVTKMAKRQAIIRNLSAVETLGCTQVICSDKTGTLTQNKMTVVKHELASSEEKLLAGMALCSDAKWDEEAGEAVGEPTECALVNDAGKAGMQGLDIEHPRVGEAPFDSGRKMMSVVVQEADGSFEQYTKGAPDVVLNLCTQVYDGDKIVPMTEARREELLAANKAMADEALRVLALASRTYAEKPTDCSAEALEHDLVFCGLSGMIDPERPEVAPAIKEAHGAGIRTVMITGDHIDTAVAIAKNLGIVTDRSQAITGAEIDKMSDAELDSQIEKYGVYARVQPEHKTRIVEAWKSKNKIVAMTGDGVNDAPSIKHANIGIGMGITGTDVTKNVADMVLADDNFATIINACEEGRRIYDNIRKVIQFLLSANLAEVFSVFAATIIGFTLFQPIQLLWVNLVTDCFPALALGMEEAEGDIMRRKPRNATDGVFAGHMGLDTVVQGLIITVLVLASFFCGVYFDMGTIDIANMMAGTADEEGVMMAFITLNMVEIFHCFNMRSRRASIFHMKKQNKWLWGAAILALILTLVVVEFDPLAEIFFGVTALEPRGMITALVLGFLIIPLVEIYKVIMRAVEKDA
ncbi:cation-translocating P-type ATPase [Collinsella ihumii]|uniref:Cation-translocating P-type ATPase n=1 Tax=Collinsella ihumii TaxID=1720204 RepID=A0ABT7XCZ5_9ACTN|nr:cation-translocating P-type ATPase [Collinsella ihumii]MBM6776552.1 cation-translocating P-type ATPase [Collinsella tanakaei]MDN0063270.1 cation-translocating P-type ATPase [Collinsella ihumii]